MNLDRLLISTSGITGNIYIGTSRDGGITFSEKRDMTQQVINAVMAHMHITGEGYECQAGELIFKAKEAEQDEANG